MTDKFRIDSHKLIFHPDRVSQYLAGKTIYPIYLEISPSGGCNHRCRFCALDYLGYQKKLFETTLLKKRISEMGQLGIKSIMFAGEGEPFLHPDMVDIARHTKDCGIDAAFTTNGVKIPIEASKELLTCATFIKISINAGTADTYRHVHRAPKEDFEKVIDISRRLVKTRAAHHLPCTLGWQMLLLPETRNEATTLAALAKEVGVDYLVIKPFSPHPQSGNTAYETVRFEVDDAFADELSAFNRDADNNSGAEGFSVIYRQDAIEKATTMTRTYEGCAGVHFWAYIDTDGRVWSCIPYIGDNRMCYGDLTESTFESIWNGERRKRVLRRINDALDISQCRVNCRMDKVNEYLWELEHPSKHVNFI